MSETRFARNCFEPAAVEIGRCGCCGDIGFRLLDEQKRIRAITYVTLAQLREVVALAEAAERETPALGRTSTHSVRH